jgi:hypothetical protein
VVFFEGADAGGGHKVCQKWRREEQASSAKMRAGTTKEAELAPVNALVAPGNA